MSAANALRLVPQPDRQGRRQQIEDLCRLAVNGDEAAHDQAVDLLTEWRNLTPEQAASRIEDVEDQLREIAAFDGFDISAVDVIPANTWVTRGDADIYLRNRLCDALDEAVGE